MNDRQSQSLTWLAIMVAFIVIMCAMGTCHGQGLQVSRWTAAGLQPRREHEARQIVGRIMANASRYRVVSRESSVPWHVIAGLHNMESGGSFRCHLHEGSPLTGRTRDIPKGRPVTGKPPFAWEESALDALRYDRMESVRWGSLEQSLAACERYNGTGYLKWHPSVPTPYLWAGTTIETAGKYTSDGKWSPTARSSQIGIAALWKLMQASRSITLPSR